MTPALFFFGAFAFLAAYNAGTMTTLQLQHYRLYPLVGRENFTAYIRANNRAAFTPTILPAMLLLVTSVVLCVTRPSFMSPRAAGVIVVLNVAQLASSLIWQRRLQAQMAETGFDARKTTLLLSTNWIRTLVFLAQAGLATQMVLRALSLRTS